MSDPQNYSKASNDYAALRPGYPTEIIEACIARTGLTPSSRILELGCGPGTATTIFAEKGD